MNISKYKKYNSVAAREWPNNIYSFNRNSEKLSSHKKDTINKITKDYFKLTRKENSFKSKRMRNLMKRSSTLRIFNSKGIIKQNSDKVNVSFHTFNKRKSKMSKNLLSFNKYLNKFKKYNFLTSVRILEKMNKHDNINLLKNTQVNDNNNSLSQASESNLTSYLKTSSISSLYLTKNNNLKYYNIYLKNMHLLTGYQAKKHKNLVLSTLNKKSNKLMSLTPKVQKKLSYKKKKVMIQRKRNLLYNRFVKNLPWSLERKRIILYKIISLRAFYNSILKSTGLSLHTSLNKNLYAITVKPLNSDKISQKNIKRLIVKLPSKFNGINTKIYSKYNNLAFSTVNRKRIKMLKELTNLKFERYIYINNILERITNQILVKYNNSNMNNSNIAILKNKLYNEFKKYNTKKLFLRFFGKQYLMLNNIYRLYIDNEKYTGMTNNLKFIFNKIYNKEVNLNITELKYLHLNADMLSNAVIIKLTSMKNRLRNVIRKTIKLARLGKPQSSVLSKSNTLYTNHMKDNKSGVTFGNLMGEMYDYRLSNTTSSNHKVYEIKDLISSTSNTSIKTLEKDVYSNVNTLNTKTKEVIKNLKHKWITGVKIESKGRLTNRFTAGRAIYKYRAKGNLRSKLRYTNENHRISKKNPYIPLFRGILMPNLQYVKKNGFRRIGSFGVKLWINNNS